MIQVAHDAEGIVPKKAGSTGGQVSKTNAGSDCNDDTDCNNCSTNDSEELRRC